MDTLEQRGCPTRADGQVGTSSASETGESPPIPSTAMGLRDPLAGLLALPTKSSLMMVTQWQVVGMPMEHVECQAPGIRMDPDPLGLTGLRRSMRSHQSLLVVSSKRPSSHCP